MKPYYERGGITIYHGDCREILPTITAADLVLTDPPYGIGKQARTFAKKSGVAEAWDSEFPTEWMTEAARIAPRLGLMCGVVNLPRIPLTVGRLVYKWTLAIHVSNGMTRGALGYGNWIPCAVYLADGASAYQMASDIQRIAISPKGKPDHPSPKPYEAMAWLVKRLPGELILDPFMGSGTTLMAAFSAGRRAIGIELEEKYCEVAVKRLEGVTRHFCARGAE